MSDRSACTYRYAYDGDPVLAHHCHRQTFMRVFRVPGLPVRELCWWHRLRKAAGL